MSGVSNILDNSDFEIFPRDPFLRACCEGNTEVVQHFLESKKIVVSSLDGRMEKSPLYLAMSNYFDDETGHKRIVQLLLEHGANPYITNSLGVSVAEKIFRNKEGLIDVLLDHLPDINKPVNKFGGYTLLHVAVRCCSEEVVRKLLVKNADVNVGTTYELPVLHEALNRERYDLIDALLEYGADVNTQNSRGFSPLHYVKNGDMVRKLVKRGANVNLKTDTGATPLNITVKISTRRNHDVLTALLDCGANFRIKNNEGQSPFGNLQKRIMRSQDLEDTLNIAELFVKHVRRTIPPDEDDRETIWIRDFGEELDAIKTQKMGDSNVTYWKFMHSTERQVAKYAKNRDIVAAVDADPYKYFTFALINKVFEGLDRKIYEEVTREMLCEILGDRLPMLVIDLIISFLSTADLEKIEKKLHREGRKKPVRKWSQRKFPVPCDNLYE